MATVDSLLTDFVNGRITHDALASALRSAQAETACDVVDDVFMYLGHRKRQAVDALFDDAVEDYKLEWMARDVFRFWCALDLNNRRRLVRLAQDFYAESV